MKPPLLILLSPSSLRTRRPNLKRRTRQRTTLGLHTRPNPQPLQTPPHQTRGEIQKRLHPPNAIRLPAEAHLIQTIPIRVALPQHAFGGLVDARLHLGRVLFRVVGHAGQGFEGVVGQDVDAAVVCFQVVDLLAEEEGPEVFAEEFYAVEGGGGAGGVAGEAERSVSGWVCR